jgi:hypothetical protein
MNNALLAPTPFKNRLAIELPSGKTLLFYTKTFLGARHVPWNNCYPALALSRLALSIKRFL